MKTAGSMIFTDTNVAVRKEVRISSASSLATIKRLIYFCNWTELCKIGVGFISLTANSITNLSFPWLLGKAIDHASEEKIVEFILGSATYFMIGSIASWTRVYCFGTATDSIAARLRQRLFESYIDRDVEYFDLVKQGEMMTLLENDIEESSETLTESLASGVRSMNSALNGSILLYRTSPHLCMVTLSIVPMIGVGAMVLSRYTSSLAKQSRTLHSQITSFCLERLSNVATVKLNNRELYEKSKYSQFMKQSTDLSQKRYHSKGGFMSFINLSANISLLVVLREGGKLLKNDTMTTGDLSRFVLQSAFVGLGFSGLATFYSDFMRSVQATARIFNAIDENTLSNNNSSSLSKSCGINDNTNNDSLPISSLDLIVSSSSINSNNSSSYNSNIINIVDDKEIKLINISFAYRSRPEVVVLDNLSIHCPMYSITCIVGTSGCGKSTLVGILSGLLLPYQGCFKIGNHIIVDHNNNNNSNIYSNNNHDSDYLHRKVGVVQQMDRSLISGTITDNIEYGKMNASQEVIENAAKLASAHDFIQDLPDKYQSEVGVGGSLLSGGQRARIALARALVKDPDYLLLDEPTSALDNKNEYDVIQALDKLRHTKSIIIITHSKAMMNIADQIYELDRGKLKVMKTINKVALL